MDAPVTPIARVMVDVALPHLDRLFDYLVPEPLDAAVVPGVRVRVRFAGSLVDAWVLERVTETDHEGRLGRIERVVSPIPVLTPEIAALVRAVADRYAGTFWDVARTAIPPRHAAAEKAFLAAETTAMPAAAPPTVPDLRLGDSSSVDVLRDTSTRGVITLSADDDRAQIIASLAVGVGPTLIIVPDSRDVARVRDAVRTHLPRGVLTIEAGLGPPARYRRWLDAAHGRAQVVIGTRSSVFLPLPDLARIIVLDDGDDAHAEPHAPGWHVREVAALRSHLQGIGVLLVGHHRTAEAQQWVSSGWAHSITASRTYMRQHAPRIEAIDPTESRDDAAASRIPHLAWRAIREGLERGAVLVSVPRRGYVPALSCASCRTPVTCPTCHARLALTAERIPSCSRCGRLAGDVRCPTCQQSRWRAGSIGQDRTVEELGRAFPSVPVQASTVDRPLTQVDPGPRIIVATPGLEPDARFAAAVILDASRTLERVDARAAEEALRRWLGVAVQVAGKDLGGHVVVVGPPQEPTIQALVRWDPVGAAERELEHRAALRLPPIARTAALTGAAADVTAVMDAMDLPAHAHVLGPVPVAQERGEEPRVRMYVSVPRAEGSALAHQVKSVVAARIARKEGGSVQVRIDPMVIG